MSSESYVIDPSPSDRDEVDSLPSISSSALDSDDDVDEAQEEWERSLEQLQMLLTMILIPFAGKYFGRKFAYWSEFPCCPLCVMVGYGRCWGRRAAESGC